MFINLKLILFSKNFKLSSLSTEFNLKDMIYCAIGIYFIPIFFFMVFIFTFFLSVSAIIGHMSFFLHQESSQERNSLEQAAQIYQQSTCDTHVKQAIENLFNGYHKNDLIHIKHGFLNLSKDSHLNPALVNVQKKLYLIIFCVWFDIFYL